MIVNFQNPIDFNSPAECLFDREDLKKAITWYSSKPVCRLKHVFLHGRYYAVSIYDQKIHIHRLLMMYWLKRDLGRFEYVHHKNGNRFNNHKDNLELMLDFQHQSITNKGRKQSPEWIKKRITKTANAKRGKKYPKNIYENPELLNETHVNPLRSEASSKDENTQ